MLPFVVSSVLIIAGNPRTIKWRSRARVVPGDPETISPRPAADENAQ